MTPDHRRDNRGLLAAAEKRLLIWMARRLPGAITSDHLSLVGLGSMALAGTALAFAPFTSWAPTVVVLALAANWFGDSLDGTVARVRGQQRPRYGFYVDHVIDLAGTTFLLAGLAASGLMTPALAAIVLAAFLLVSAESYLATHAAGIFRISFAGCGPTELRIILAVGIITAVRKPVVTLGPLGPQRLFDVGGVVAASLMALAFIVTAVGRTRALFLAEPVPAPSARSDA
jgi:phosphatidylglycerophosphate synthase